MTLRYGLIKVFSKESIGNIKSLDITQCDDGTMEFRICDEDNNDVSIQYFDHKQCLEIANTILRFLYNEAIKTKGEI